MEDDDDCLDDSQNTPGPSAASRVKNGPAADQDCQLSAVAIDRIKEMTEKLREKNMLVVRQIHKLLVEESTLRLDLDDNIDTMPIADYHRKMDRLLKLEGERETMDDDLQKMRQSVAKTLRKSKASVLCKMAADIETGSGDWPRVRQRYLDMEPEELQQRLRRDEAASPAPTSTSGDAITDIFSDDSDSDSENEVEICEIKFESGADLLRGVPMDQITDYINERIRATLATPMLKCDTMESWKQWMGNFNEQEKLQLGCAQLHALTKEAYQRYLMEIRGVRRQRGTNLLDIFAEIYEEDKTAAGEEDEPEEDHRPLCIADYADDFP